MYEILNAHPVSVVIIAGAIMAAPFYLFAVYAFSNAPLVKGAKISLGFLLFGALMFLVCISDIPNKLGVAGDLIVPLLWASPSLILYLMRDWFLSDPLSQKWIIALQLFRAIGFVFLLEMLMGNVPGIFAYPAGIGDILVALIALFVLIASRNASSVSGTAIKLVIVAGVIDFSGAIFFGFISGDTLVQLVEPEIANRVLVFPVGMIPLFLVPCAIFFHTLSWLNYAKFGALPEPSYQAMTRPV